MAFRRWWVAQLTSNVGSWMQTVAAQWLMISLTSSAILVGAIQATNLPVLALAIPGGVLGDLLKPQAPDPVRPVRDAALGGVRSECSTSPAR